MKAQIIGCGMVGSAIARELLETRKFREMHLVDTNKKVARGQCLDLYRVRCLKSIDTMLSYGIDIRAGQDVTIISAGHRCDYGSFSKRDDAIADLGIRNWPIVYDIARKVSGGDIIIVTNPAEKLGRRLRCSFPDKRISWAGAMIDMIHDGKDIMDMKGYTNWGIAAEVGLMLNPDKSCFLKNGEVILNGDSKAEESCQEEHKEGAQKVA